MDILLLNHVRQLRRKAVYNKAHIIVYIEANMSYISANRVATLFRDNGVENMYFVSQDPTPKNGHMREGVWTGDIEKEVFTTRIQTLLADNQLHFAETFISHRPEKEIKNLMITQLEKFRLDITPPKDLIHGKARRGYSGKSPGEKDDVVMALEICAGQMMQTRYSSSYLRAAEMGGWHDELDELNS